MTANGISWGGARSRLHRAAAAALGAALAAPLAGGLAPPGTTARAPSTQMMSVIVQRAAGVSGAAERAVTRAGGKIGRQIGIIDGFTAKVPADKVSGLQRAQGISWVSPDGQVRLMGTNDGGYNPQTDKHSVYTATVDDGAQALWASGITGQGVDVAIIDSGIAPVDGLNAPGKVVNGPDLSFESQDASAAHVDTYGHGTHMA